MCSMRKWILVCCCYCIVFEGASLSQILSGRTLKQLEIVAKSDYSSSETYMMLWSTRSSILGTFGQCFGRYFLGGVISAPFLSMYCWWYADEQSLTTMEKLTYATFYNIVPPCTPLPGTGTLGPNTMRAFSLGPMCPALSCSPVQLATPSVPPT